MSMNKEIPEKMDLHSLDVSEENRTNLKQLLPSVFTETHDEKGELVESIDFEKLKAELGTFSDVFEARRERYGMDWPGKKEALKLIQQPSVATLKPCREESISFDTTKNLFIEGDNLEVLKLLQKSYYGKVKMIYIDPPYNTGEQFIYPDKYSETLETYLAYAGLVDDEGKKFSSSSPSEGRFHTKWLNMMYPRLYLARNLLKEDGVIFISIDDNEVNNLRKLCDDVFGEENFLAQIVWQKIHSTKNDAKYYSDSHEYILCYCKNIDYVEIKLLPRTEKMDSRFKNPDDDPRGPWSSGDLVANGERKDGYYDVPGPTGQIFNVPKGKHWVCSKDNMQKLISEERIWFGQSGDSFPRLKRYLSEVQQGRKVDTLWLSSEVGHNQESTREVKAIFDGNSYFDTAKPVRLLKRCSEISLSQTDIVLDFFAGSCTTAHSVMDLNREDHGNRKFIMVQLPEPCEETSAAFTAGYKNIAEIGKERIRRVIKKIQEEQDNEAKQAKSKLPGIAEEQSELDLGFKVLKLDKSNFRIWEGSNPDASEEEIVNQLEMHIDHISSNATQEDIFFELLLKAGFKLAEKVEKLELAGKTVFSIAEGALLICLEDEITCELIDAVAEAEPFQFICLDRGFSGNDQLKANAVQTFTARNQGRDKAQQIVFRTV